MLFRSLPNGDGHLVSLADRRRRAARLLLSLISHDDHSRLWGLGPARDGSNVPAGRFSAQLYDFAGLLALHGALDKIAPTRERVAHFLDQRITLVNSSD